MTPTVMEVLWCELGSLRWANRQGVGHMIRMIFIHEWKDVISLCLAIRRYVYSQVRFTDGQGVTTLICMFTAPLWLHFAPHVQKSSCAHAREGTGPSLFVDYRPPAPATTDHHQPGCHFLPVALSV